MFVSAAAPWGVLSSERVRTGPAMAALGIVREHVWDTSESWGVRDRGLTAVLSTKTIHGYRNLLGFPFLVVGKWGW